MSSYTNADLDRFEALFEQAALILDEDSYFDLILTLDPDRSIEDALADRQHVAELARVAMLSDAERIAEDVDRERFVQVGLNIMRSILRAKRTE